MEYIRANPFQESLRSYPPINPPSDSVTCIFDNKIVAVAGIVDSSEDEGEVWLALTKECRKKGIFGWIAFCVIEKKLKELITEHNLKRCNAVTRVDFPEAIKMLEAFGFEYMGIRKEYTPDGCDVRVYSKVI